MLASTCFTPEDLGFVRIQLHLLDRIRSWRWHWRTQIADRTDRVACWVRMCGTCLSHRFAVCAKSCYLTSGANVTAWQKLMTCKTFYVVLKFQHNVEPRASHVLIARSRSGCKELSLLWSGTYQCAALIFCSNGDRVIMILWVAALVSCLHYDHWVFLYRRWLHALTLCPYFAIL